MRNVITRVCKSCSPFIQLNLGLKCLAAMPIALGISVGISNWQESTVSYWRDFNNVRVEHLRTQKGIAIGELAPPFILKSKDGKHNVSLQSLARKPVVLIFGSYSCGPFRSQFGSIDRLYQQFGEQVTFCFVYKVESHPNFLPHAKSLAERAERAEWVCTESNSSMPVLLDDLQNSVADAYHVFDEKVVLIDQGKIVFFNQGRLEGPDFRMVEDLQIAIVALLERKNS